MLYVCLLGMQAYFASMLLLIEVLRLTSWWCDDLKQEHSEFLVPYRTECSAPFKNSA